MTKIDVSFSQKEENWRKELSSATLSIEDKRAGRIHYGVSCIFVEKTLERGILTRSERLINPPMQNTGTSLYLCRRSSGSHFATKEIMSAVVLRNHMRQIQSMRTHNRLAKLRAEKEASENSKSVTTKRRSKTKFSKTTRK